MRHNRGFTLIEVLITITVMVVLLVLAVVSMSDSEARGRDEERKSDTTSIAQLLETYYVSGIDTSPAIGEYPSTDQVDTEAEVVSLLRGIDPNVLRGPSLNGNASMTFAVATTATNPPSPAPTTATTAPTASYVYQPLTSTGQLCNSAAMECRKFNLYYSLEKTAGVQVITSRNQ